MSQPNPDLHGSAPDKAAAALLLVDVINPFDFPEADDLLRFALPVAEQLAGLKARAKTAGLPVIYGNDNFGRWRSDHQAVLAECLKPDRRGREFVERLRPADDDYFVLKPKHSAFFSTTLDTLLRYLGTKTLLIGGIAGNICVLFTANDAYLRDLKLIVPADGTASNTAEENATAVEQMRRVLKADVRPAAEWSAARLTRLAAGH
ncbi:MAG: isochorismatase family cysteine hydrolase [Gemmataceae bacterium]